MDIIAHRTEKSNLYFDKNQKRAEIGSFLVLEEHVLCLRLDLLRCDEGNPRGVARPCGNDLLCGPCEDVAIPCGYGIVIKLSCRGDLALKMHILLHCIALSTERQTRFLLDRQSIHIGAKQGAAVTSLPDISYYTTSKLLVLYRHIAKTRFDVFNSARQVKANLGKPVDAFVILYYFILYFQSLI